MFNTSNICTHTHITQAVFKILDDLTCLSAYICVYIANVRYIKYMYTHTLHAGGVHNSRRLDMSLSYYISIYS